MATGSDVKTFSFDVCGLDDPKIEIVQNVIKPGGNISTLRKYVYSDTGFKVSYHKFENRNEWPSIGTGSKPYVTVVNLLQVNV